jgi:hypothetical protein
MVDHRMTDLVSLGGELPLHEGDEDPEVRIGRGRVHLGDEEDPHGRAA